MAVGILLTDSEWKMHAAMARLEMSFLREEGEDRMMCFVPTSSTSGRIHEFRRAGYSFIGPMISTYVVEGTE